MGLSIKNCCNFIKREGLLCVTSGAIGVLGAYFIKQIFVKGAEPLLYGLFINVCALVAFAANKCFNEQYSLKILLGVAVGFYITNLYQTMTLTQMSVTTGIIIVISGISIALRISNGGKTTDQIQRIFSFGELDININLEDD